MYGKFCATLDVIQAAKATLVIREYNVIVDEAPACCRFQSGWDVAQSGGSKLVSNVCSREAAFLREYLVNSSAVVDSRWREELRGCKHYLRVIRFRV